MITDTDRTGGSFSHSVNFHPNSPATLIPFCITFLHDPRRDQGSQASDPSEDHDPQITAENVAACRKRKGRIGERGAECPPKAHGHLN